MSAVITGGGINYDVAQGISMTMSPMDERYVAITDPKIPFAPYQSDDPLYVMLSRLKGGVRPWHNKEMQWGTRTGVPRIVTSGAAAIGDATITFADGQYQNIRQYDMLKNINTGEIVFVTATPSSTSVAVTRGYGETDAVAVTDGDEWIRLGNAQKEDHVSGDTLRTNPSYKSNYLQEIEHPFDCTERLLRTAKAKGFVGNDEWEWNREDTLRDHNNACEATLWNGTKSINATDGTTTTAGLMEFINDATAPSLKGDFSGVSSFGYADFRDFVAESIKFAQGGEQFVSFTGSVLPNIAADWGANSIQRSENSKVFGWAYDKIKVKGKEVILLEHPLFDSWGMAGHFVTIPLQYVNLWAMDAAMAKTMLDLGPNGKGIQAPDRTIKKARFRREFGVRVDHLEQFSVGTGLS